MNLQELLKQFDEKFGHLTFAGTLEDALEGKWTPLKEHEQIKAFITKALEEQREEFKKLVESKLGTEDHVCRFNDGEQRCECYNEALQDLLDSLT